MTLEYLVNGVPQPPEKEIPEEIFLGCGINGDDNVISKESKSYLKIRKYESGNIHYSARFHSGHLFDPWGTFEGQERASKWVKVTEEVADKYRQYLRTRNKAHYAHSNRRHLDG